LGFEWSFQHGTPDMIVQWVQIWIVWGPLVLLNESDTVRLQLILRDACRVSWSAVLLEDEYLRKKNCLFGLRSLMTLLIF